MIFSLHLEVILARTTSLFFLLTDKNGKFPGMLVIGGVVSGYVSALIGVEACYILDSVTYFISAGIMSKVQGEFYATDPTTFEKERKDINEYASFSDQLTTTVINPIKIFVRMSRELLSFLFTCGFGALIFMKGTGTFIWGAADVLNVSFAHVENDEAESARRIGTIYR